MAPQLEWCETQSANRHGSLEDLAGLEESDVWVALTEGTLQLEYTKLIGLNHKCVSCPESCISIRAYVFLSCSAFGKGWKCDL